MPSFENKPMKTLIVIFVFFCCTAMESYSQYYSATYAHNLLLPDLNAFEGVLIFSAEFWRYDLDLDGIGPDSDNENDLIIKIGSVFNFRTMKGKYFLDQEPIFSKKHILKGELALPEWAIEEDSTRQIGGYNCLLAKADVCGRSFVVWFTPEIPVNCGPWKLWGLPGLIVDAQSVDGAIDIKLKSLKNHDTAPIEPTVEETITPSEYSRLLKQSFDRLGRALKSMDAGRDYDVDASVKIQIADKSLLP